MNNYSDCFKPGFKGVFELFPMHSLIREKTFIISCILSIFVSVCILIFDADSFVRYIDLILSFSVDIIPSLIGLSLAGLAVFMSQGEKNFMQRITELTLGSVEKPHSFYQKVNASFAVTIILQLISLFVSILVLVIKPITLSIPVNPVWSLVVNFSAYLLCFFLFVYSMLSIIDVTATLFSAGQAVNCTLFVEKNKERPPHDIANTDTKKNPRGNARG